MDFFSELKHAREAKNISLGEISDATLINLKMLEALERGDTKIVPQAYLRAFIREYASVIGLDKDETIAKYDAWQQSSKQKPATPPPTAPKEEKPPDVATPSTTPPTAPTDAERKKRERLERFAPIFLKIVLAIAVLVMVDIVLWSVLDKEPTQAIQEWTFRDVVKDAEKRAGLTDTTQKGDTVAVKRLPAQPIKRDSVVQPLVTPPPTQLSGDSLTLVGTATDSVWMEIVTDDDVLTEHYLLPNQTISWRAKNEFWISAIGNPTALKLRLNNKPIAIPVTPGRVTRDLRINRDSLLTR